MKLRYILYVVCLTGILFCKKINAQTPDTNRFAHSFFKPFSKDDVFRTWSVGINGGLMTYSNILYRNNQLDFTSPSSKLGYSIYVKKQILPLLGIQAQYMGGNLVASNSQQTTNGDPDYLHTQTKFDYAASLNLIFNFVDFNWHYNSIGVQPFLGVGFGLMSYHPQVTTIDIDGIFHTTKAVKLNGSFIPVQLGFKFNVSSNINIDLAYQLNMATTDDVDGVVYGASKDKFSYLNAGLELSLGKRLKPKMATYSTAPPPKQHPLKRNKGVPEKVVPAKVVPQKAKPDTARVQEAPAQPNNNLLNDKLKALQTDSDGDGIADYFDKCPNTPPDVAVDNLGCPIPVASVRTKGVLSEKERQILANAAKNIDFANGKSSLSKASLQLLDELLRLLIEKKMDTNFPVQVLIISGHADDFNSDIDNLTLSTDRAATIKNYLLAKGIKSANLITVGYGNEKPTTSVSGNTVRITKGVDFLLY